MLNKNIETFIGCDKGYDEASTVLFGAPFDSTTSFRPGARFGPKAIRGESFGLETYSPYQDRDLNDITVFDAGDLELPFGSPERALKQIEGVAAQILADGKRPFLLGGEHLVTLGAFRAALKAYPDLAVIHLDAHTDLREDYLGEKLSHATVMRRIWELVGDKNIYQFGIRSGEKSEFSFSREHLSLTPFNLHGFAALMKELEGRPIYFTLDLDVLDPSVFPGTGTPEAGGVSFQDLLIALMELRHLQVVACDVNELAPNYDPTGASTAVACKVVRELLLAVNQ